MIKSQSQHVYIMCILTLLVCSHYTLNSQSTYFNVPRFMTKTEGNFYIQSNLFTSKTQDKIVLNGMYRVLKNTDIGAVFINHSNAIWTGISVQHLTEIYPDQHFNVGGVYVPVCSGACLEEGYYVYGLISSNSLINKAHVNVGIYYGNNQFFGNYSKVGLMAGADYSILNGKVILKGEFMSGNNGMSGLNFGGTYIVSQNLGFGFGVNLVSPYPNNRPLILQLIFNK